MKHLTKATGLLWLPLLLGLLLLTLTACDAVTPGDPPEGGPAAETTWSMPPDYEDPDKDHVHTFSDSWSFNSAGHWHAATCSHPFERSDYAPHTGEATEYPAGCVTYAYSIGTCSVCGYAGDTTHFDRLPGHNYVGGVCTVCSARQPAFGSYTVRFHLQDADVYTVTVNYDGTVQSLTPATNYMKLCLNVGLLSAWSYEENSPLGIDPSCWVPEYLDLYPIAHDICVHEYAIARETPATCTESATMERVCTKCGHHKQESVGSPLGHDFQNGVCVRCGGTDIVYPASGTVTFHHESVVDTLHYSLNNDYDLMLFQGEVHSQLARILEHDPRSFRGWKISPDATEKYDGKWFPFITDYYLIDESECRHPETRQETIAPTCTKEGAERTVCSLCGKCLSETPLEKLPHQYVNGICSECGLREGEFVHGFYDIQTYQSDGSLFRSINFKYDGVSFEQLQRMLDMYNDMLRGNGWATEFGSKTPFVASQWTPDVKALYNIPRDPEQTTGAETTSPETPKTWPAGTYDVVLHTASGETMTVKVAFDGARAGNLTSTLHMYQAMCGAQNGWSVTPDGTTTLDPNRWTPEYLDLYPLNP